MEGRKIKKGVDMRYLTIHKIVFNWCLFYFLSTLSKKLSYAIKWQIRKGEKTPLRYIYHLKIKKIAAKRRLYHEYI